MQGKSGRGRRERTWFDSERAYLREKELSKEEVYD